MHVLSQGQGALRQHNQLTLKERILYDLGGSKRRGPFSDMVMQCEKDWTSHHWL